MRAQILLLLAATLSTGCGTTSRMDSSFGYFNPTPVSEHDEYLAEDAARQLTVLLPPAATKLELLQHPSDRFGESLVSLLRGKGFALQEGKSNAPSFKAQNALDSTPMSYIVDFMDAPVMYRVTVHFGDHSISRAYQPKGKLVQPAGEWVRRE